MFRSTLVFLLAVMCVFNRELGEAYDEVNRNFGDYPEQGSFPPYPIVQTTSGPVQGTTLSESHVFFNIPYAVPPVGAKRFLPPEPYLTQSTIINATTYKPIYCPQLIPQCKKRLCDFVREDCLVLTVYVPTKINFDQSTPKDLLLPVMFYIHGGGFIYGSSTEPILDSKSLCNVTENIIVVVSYRLGPLGFLVYGNSIKGNQGLKDQQLAMKWVQDNIENFGGDKNQVTIFGQSSGAQAVTLHLLSKFSEPMFARAIIESNPCAYTYLTADESKITTGLVLDAVNCSGKLNELECLRNIPAYNLISIQEEVITKAVALGDEFAINQPYRPILDGVEFKNQPLNSFRDGKWNKNNDLIIGTTSQELEVQQFWIPDNPPFNEAAFNNTLINRFGPDDGAKISLEYIQKYPAKNPNDYRETYGILQTHYVFTCPSRALARFASSSERSVYFYVSTHPLRLSDYNVFGIVSNLSLAFHVSEIPFIMRSGPSYGIKFNHNDYLVANAFNTYWGSFAKTGNPSSRMERSLGKFTEWPLYTDPFRKTLMIDAPQTTVSNDYLASICDFWDDLNIYVDMSSFKSPKNSLDNFYEQKKKTMEAFKRTTNKLLYLFKLLFKQTAAAA